MSNENTAADVSDFFEIRRGITAAHVRAACLACADLDDVARYNAVGRIAQHCRTWAPEFSGAASAFQSFGAAAVAFRALGAA